MSDQDQPAPGMTQLGPDETEIKRVFVSKGKGERLTAIVRYHPPTRAEGDPPTDVPEKVKEFIESLQAQAEDAMS